jgi:hypothetical protein
VTSSIILNTGLALLYSTSMPLLKLNSVTCLSTDRLYLPGISPQVSSLAGVITTLSLTWPSTALFNRGGVAIAIIRKRREKEPRRTTPDMKQAFLEQAAISVFLLVQRFDYI